MGKIRKIYTREFKVEAVRLLEESEFGAQQIADDLGISTSSLHRWRRELRADPEQAFPGNGNLNPGTRKWSSCAENCTECAKKEIF